jgi:hypothetical protein
MKKIIIPVFFAILLTILCKTYNPNIEADGYIMATGVGLIVGSFLNKLVFKEKAIEKGEKGSVAK